ncbi:MAG: sirohydrochlorin cobaltochelatase [Anaerovoracaceae bacterium]
MKKDKVLLVVSFGTSYKETREKTIGAIENDMANAFADMEVRRAFTSGMIMNVIKKRDGIHIDNVTEAMEKIIADGFKKVYVQPTHILNGDEYEKMLGLIVPFVPQVDKIVIGAPLLTESKDYEDVCHSIVEETSYAKDDEAVVLMGHGTGHYVDSAYAAMDYRFKALSYKNYFVGTVEGYPELEDILPMIKEFNPKKVHLLPMMIVAGDHATNDMASDEEDSWKTVFENEGYDVAVDLRGMGEFPKIREIYVNHLKKEIEENEK